MKNVMQAALFVFALGAPGCHHSDAQGAQAPDHDDAVDAVRTRAAFDLGCKEADIKVAQLQAGSLMTAASYGATCGDKRASYIERMGTVIKQ